MPDLSPEQRTQLDGIVQQMHDNHETDDYVQSVVDDYKSKHAAPFDVNTQNATMRANMAKQREGEPTAAYALTPGGKPARASAMVLGVPVSAVGEPARVDTNVIGTPSGAGLAPEDLLMGGQAVAGLSRAAKAGGALGAAKNAVSQASPVIKYELARRGMTALGVPGPVATVLAFGATGGRSGVNPEAAKAAEAERLSSAGVVPTADVAATNPNAARSVVRLPFAPSHAQPPVSASVVPLADVSASNPAALNTSGAHRSPLVETTGESLARMMRQKLGLQEPVLGEDANVTVHPSMRRGPEPQGVGMERNVDLPLHEQQTRMENEQIRSGAAAIEPPAGGRLSTPTHLQEGSRGSEAGPVAKFGFEWPGVGDQYELLQDIPGHPKGSHVMADTLKKAGVPVPEKPTGHIEPTVEVVGEGGPNASGESAASAEALSRLKGMAARGEEFVVKKGNTIRKLVGPEAVDYQPQAGETFGVRDKDGNFRLLSQGEVKQALTASRGKGAMPIAMRRALYNQLTKQSGK